MQVHGKEKGNRKGGRGGISDLEKANIKNISIEERGGGKLTEKREGMGAKSQKDCLLPWIRSKLTPSPDCHTNPE